MKKYAIILDGSVHQIFEGTPPEFGPDTDGNPILCIEVDDDVCEKWLYNPRAAKGRSQFAAPPPPEPPTPEELDAMSAEAQPHLPIITLEDVMAAIIDLQATQAQILATLTGSEAPK